MKKVFYLLTLAAMLLVPAATKAQLSCPDGATSCSIVIECTDSYGDGWNGNAINVYQGETLRGTVTLDAGAAYGIFEVPVCTEDSIRFEWVEGDYAYEASYVILNGDEDTIFSGSGSMATIYAWPVCPSCVKPSDLAVSDITSDGCTITWHARSGESEWNIYLNGEFHATTYDTTYTFTDLEANTTYSYGVQANCGGEDVSNIANGTFKTDCTNGSCLLTVVPSSSWGSFYNPTVDVMQNGGLIASVNSATDVPICNGDSVIIIYSVPPLYDGSNINVTVIDVAGVELLSNLDLNSHAVGDTLLALESGCPTCLPPTGLTVDESLTDTTTITINWNSVDTVLGYIVAINNVEVDDNPIVGDTYTFTELSPASPYTITVRAMCTYEDTSYFSTISAMTDCGILTIDEENPYFNDFEAYEGEVAIPCWTMDPTYVIKGDGGLFFKNYSAGHAAVMPVMDQPVSSLEVVFDAKVGTTGDDPDDIVIGVANAAGDSVVWLDTLHNANQSRASFTEFSYRFDGYDGDLTRIAFTNKNYIANWMLIDNLQVRFIPACIAPTTIEGHNLLNADSSYFTWVDAGEAGTFQVVIGTPEQNIDDIEGEAVTVEETSYLAPEGTLEAGSKYILYVRSDCGESYSEWKTLEFAAGTVILPASGTDTVQGCGFVVYDNGGPYSGYIGGSTSAVVILPENEGDIVKVTGGWVTTYENNSTLSIYDGEGTNGVLLYSTNGTDSIPEIIGEENSITIAFNAASLVSHGFEVFTSCAAGPTCFKPKDLTASNIQPESVDLTWTNGNAVEMGGSFHIYYREEGSDEWQTVVANDMSTTLNGLTDGTHYELYVRGFCSEEDSSSASSTIHFTTPCFATTIDATNSIVESFESEEAPAQCFTLVNGGSHSSYTSYSGSRSMYFNTNGATLISPLLETSGIVNLKFMYRGSSYTWYGTTNFSVGYSTAGSGIDEFTWHNSVNATNDNWEEHFDTVPAGVTYIAIRFNSGDEVNIDSLVIEANDGTMPCAKPYITSTFPGTNNIEVSWTSPVDTCYVAIMTSESWDETLATDIMVLDGTYNFTGLTSNTDYVIGVRTICGDGSLSDYATVSVTTYYGYYDCDAPTITGTEVSDNSATVTFNGTAASYEVELVEGSWMGSMGNQVTTTETSYTFNDLTIGTEYTIAVRAVCDPDGFSDWATTSFTVEADIECNAPTNLRTVNLTGTMASIDWDVNGSETSWQMLFAGEVRPVSGHPYILNNLTPGTSYSVRVRAVCSTSENSDWSEEFTFQTPTVGIDGVDGIAVSMFPNPATSVVAIETGEPSLVTIVDLNGREVYRAESDGSLSVNVATMAKGAYFVRIASDNGIAVRKLIVK